jgi:hypothetical protein
MTSEPCPLVEGVPAQICTGSPLKVGVPVAMVGQVPLIFGRYCADGLVPSLDPVVASAPLDELEVFPASFTVPELLPELEPLVDPELPCVDASSDPVAEPESEPVESSSPPELELERPPLPGSDEPAQATKRKQNAAPPRVACQRMTVLKLGARVRTTPQTSQFREYLAITT